MEAIRGAGAQACNCKRDRLWLHFPLEETKYLIFPCSGKRGVEFGAMPPKYDGKCETESLSTRFYLHTLLCYPGSIHDWDK